MDGGSKTSAVGELHDAQLALWNGLESRSSLILTWGVRSLSASCSHDTWAPTARPHSFAEAMALTFFVFATLGVGTYVQGDSDPAEHASEFFGASRGATCCPLGAALAVSSRSSRSPADPSTCSSPRSRSASASSSSCKQHLRRMLTRTARSTAVRHQRRDEGQLGPCASSRRCTSGRACGARRRVVRARPRRCGPSSSFAAVCRRTCR